MKKHIRARTGLSDTFDGGDDDDDMLNVGVLRKLFGQHAGWKTSKKAKVNGSSVRIWVFDPKFKQSDESKWMKQITKEANRFTFDEDDVLN